MRSQSTEVVPAGVRQSMWIDAAALGFAYVGAVTIVPSWASLRVAELSSLFIVLCGLAAYGWVTKPTVPSRGAVLSAFALGIWFLISSLAAWVSSSLYLGLANTAWLVFVVPGVASLLGLDRLRRALVWGVLVGAGYYLVHFLLRLLGPGPLTDDVGRSTFLGENRNAVSLRLVFVVALMLTDSGSRLFRWIRWPVAALLVLWILTVGGRSAVLALALMGLTQLAASPGTARRARHVAIVLAVSLTFVATATVIGAPYLPALVQVQDTFAEPRTAADDAREVLARKAIDTMMSHPAFGVGIGLFASADFDTSAHAQTRRGADLALGPSAHNLYLQLGATLGIPGMVLLLALQGSALARGYRFRSSAQVRAAALGVIGVAVVATFHSVLGPTLYLPIAFLLGTTATPGRGEQPAGERDRAD